MIRIKIPSKRKCLATIDMARSQKAVLSFEQRGKLIEIEFDKAQWVDFRQLVKEFIWKKRNHSGFC